MVAVISRGIDTESLLGQARLGQITLGKAG